MEIKNRQKLLMIVAGVGVLLLVGDSLLFEPMLRSWRARDKRIDDMRQQVSDGKSLLQREAALRSRWDSMRTNALPSNQSMGEAELFKAFDRWERASGITRVGIKPQWKQGDDDSYATLECRADYNGDIDKIKRFLYEMEKDPMGIKVDNVEISSHDDSGLQLSLGLQVSGLQLNLSPASQQP
jgi:hypothetical protein